MVSKLYSDCICCVHRNSRYDDVFILCVITYNTYTLFPNVSSRFNSRERMKGGGACGVRNETSSPVIYGDIRLSLNCRHYIGDRCEVKIKYTLVSGIIKWDIVFFVSCMYIDR